MLESFERSISFWCRSSSYKYIYVEFYMYEQFDGQHYSSEDARLSLTHKLTRRVYVDVFRMLNEMLPTHYIAVHEQMHVHDFRVSHTHRFQLHTPPLQSSIKHSDSEAPSTRCKSQRVGSRWRSWAHEAQNTSLALQWRLCVRLIIVTTVVG